MTGNRLVTVDVQGGLSAEEAMAAAVDLATQQAACLASDDPCASVTATLTGGRNLRLITTTFGRLF